MLKVQQITIVSCELVNTPTKKNTSEQSKGVEKKFTLIKLEIAVDIYIMGKVCIKGYYTTPHSSIVY